MQLEIISSSSLLGLATIFPALSAAEEQESQQEDNDQAEEVLRLLNSRLLLTERERVVLTRRFGINTDHEESFESIGKDLGLTAERVRQLQHQGLAKLRRKLTGDNCNLTLLSNYLTGS